MDVADFDDAFPPAARKPSSYRRGTQCAFHYGVWPMPPGLRITTLRYFSRRKVMLYWTVVFLIVAMVAALFGFTGIYLAAAEIAKILFVIFIVLFLVSLVAGGLNRRPMA